MTQMIRICISIFLRQTVRVIEFRTADTRSGQCICAKMHLLPSTAYWTSYAASRLVRKTYSGNVPFLLFGQSARKKPSQRRADVFFLFFVVQVYEFGALLFFLARQKGEEGGGRENWLFNCVLLYRDVYSKGLLWYITTVCRKTFEMKYKDKSYAIFTFRRSKEQ